MSILYQTEEILNRSDQTNKNTSQPSAIRRGGGCGEGREQEFQLRVWEMFHKIHQSRLLVTVVTILSKQWKLQLKLDWTPGAGENRKSQPDHRRLQFFLEISEIQWEPESGISILPVLCKHPTVSCLHSWRRQQNSVNKDRVQREKNVCSSLLAPV